VTAELSFIAALRAVATDPAARALADDAAVVAIGGEQLVLTLDTLVETVHFLPADPPADIAWKLVAVNVSDLAAKGARPLGCLYSHALGEDAWDAAFLAGLDEACRHFALPLLGGDTVRMPAGASRSFSLTALGTVPIDRSVPSRSGAKAGDTVWLSGPVGDAGLGLRALQGSLEGVADAVEAVVAAYRRPRPDPVLGRTLAPLVSAMMDVSDGVLIDARRMAEASGVEFRIDLGALPLSPAHRALAGDDLAARLAAATAGDDYCLLFTAPMAIKTQVRALGRHLTAVGSVHEGGGTSLVHEGSPVPLPALLGYQH
jgi:thiamine-monophosphate kinase